MTTTCAATCEGTFMTVDEVFGKLTSMRNRKDKNAWLKSLVPTLQGEEWDKYRTALRGEVFHVDHVRMIMSQKTNKSNNHDWSKDEYYFFVTISYFTMGKKELVQQEFTTEVNRHYELEPHHPENEALTGNRLNHDNVMEMAIDRLSRNFQKNGGVLNMAQMKSFAPKFVSNQENNLQMYWQYVEELTELVRSTYNQLHPQ